MGDVIRERLVGEGAIDPAGGHGREHDDGGEVRAGMSI